MRCLADEGPFTRTCRPCCRHGIENALRKTDRFLARGAAAIGHAIALRVIEKPAPARMFFAGIWFVIVADATDLRAAPNDAVVALGLQRWLRRANVHSASSRNLEED